jgi:hypothetical protein
MTDEQGASLVNEVKRLADAIQVNPVRKFLEQKEYEDRLMKTYGPDLVNAWKKEYFAVDQARQYVEHEGKIYKEKYELTYKLLADIMMQCDVSPRRSSTLAAYNIQEAFDEYKKDIDKISSQYDATP